MRRVPGYIRLSGSHSVKTPYVKGQSSEPESTLARNLAEAAQQFPLLVKHLPAAVAILDRDLTYLAVSDRWYQDYRLEHQELVGRKHFDLFPNTPELWQAAYQRCLNGSVEHDEGELPRPQQGCAEWIRWEAHPWERQDGSIGGIFLFTEVLTEYHQLETELYQRRQQQESLVRHERYLLTLVEIQQKLLTLAKAPGPYTGLLEPLGQVAGASRVYIFENHTDAQGRLFTSQQAEWCAPGVEPKTSNPQWQNLPYDQMPFWLNHLSQGHAINSSVTELPEPERSYLQSHGVLSVLVLPLQVNGQFFGFIGFEDCSIARHWERVEIGLLSTAAAALSLALERRLSEQELQRCQALLEKGVAERTRELAIANERLQLEIGTHQQTERALREHEAFLQSIYTGAELAIFVVDVTEEGNFLYAGFNAAYERLTGLNAAESRLKMPEDLFSESDQNVAAVMRNRFARCLELERSIDYEERILLEGQETWWLTRLTPLYEDEVIYRLIGTAIPITDLKQAESALRASETRYRALVESQTDVVCRALPDTTITFINETPLRLMERRREEFIGHRWIHAVHPEDQPVVLEQIAALTPDHAIVTLEYRNINPQNEVFWYQWTLQGFFDQHGTLIEIQSVGRDISDRKRAEEALLQQARRAQGLNRVIQVIRNSLDLPTIFSTAVSEIAQLIQADRVGILQYHPARGMWVRVQGYRRDQSWRDGSGLEIPDANNPLAAQLKRGELVLLNAAHNSLGEMNQEVAAAFPGAWLVAPLHPGSDMANLPVWGALALVRNSPGAWQPWEVELARAVSDQLAIAIQQSLLYQQVQQFNTELEQQVQARTQELQQALQYEELLKRITDKVRDSLDENQILQTVVRELTLGLGIEGCDTAIYDLDRQTSTIAYEYSTTLPPAKGERVPFAIRPNLYRQLQQGWASQFCSIWPDSTRPLLKQLTILACPISDDQGVLGDLWLFKPRQANFNDLEIRLVQQVVNQCAIAIRQARLYQVAQAQVVVLEELHQLKDSFLKAISRDLASPMTHLELAAQQLGTGTDQMGLFHRIQEILDRYIHILGSECRWEVTLIEDLLALARLAAGAEALPQEPLNLHTWLPGVVEPFLNRIHNRQQRFSLNVEDSLPPLLLAPIALEQILVELLHNACKYTPAGGQITLSVGYSPRKWPCLEIKVSNTGAEIPVKQQQQIFERFYRIPDQDPWQAGGLGLGLFLVRQLVERLGGAIRVESGTDKTAFLLLLPIQVS